MAIYNVRPDVPAGTRFWILLGTILASTRLTFFPFRCTDLAFQPYYSRDEYSCWLCQKGSFLLLQHLDFDA